MTLPKHMKTMRGKSQEPEEDWDLDAMEMVDKRKRGIPVVDATNTPSTSVPLPTEAIPERDDYEAQDALATILRANELRANKGLMVRVKRQAKKEAMARARVARLEGKTL